MTVLQRKWRIHNHLRTRLPKAGSRTRTFNHLPLLALKINGERGVKIDRATVRATVNECAVILC